MKIKRMKYANKISSKLRKYEENGLKKYYSRNVKENRK